jgi:hypothetical protein
MGHFMTSTLHFFHDLNELEKGYSRGLQLTHGADMCSLQKSVKRGKCWKRLWQFHMFRHIILFLQYIIAPCLFMMHLHFFTGVL